MDKTANGKEKVTKADAYKDTIRSIVLPVDPEKINEIEKSLDEFTASQKQSISILQQQFNMMFSNKVTLQEMLNLAVLSYSMAQWTTVTLYSVDILNRRLSNIEKIVEQIAQKPTIDLSSVKSELESLKKTLISEDFVNVNNFVKRIQTDIDKYNKKKQENDLAT